MLMFNVQLAVIGLVAIFASCVVAAFQLKWASAGGRFTWHSILETRPLAFTLLVVLAVVAGGLVELLPGIVMRREVPMTVGGQIAVAPYTPLELEGRDVYVREGCYVCHSQMVRPFRAEVERYGAYSVAGEFVYDRPFQWGSKRTGPDLHRVGGRYSDDWHRLHLMNPRDLVPESNMPGYPWLAKTPAAAEDIEGKLRALRRLGVPYSDEDIRGARTMLDGKTELDALVAYLQGLGTAVKRGN
jgi:cytochrome c oxidase cbb3-type subunit 2